MVLLARRPLCRHVDRALARRVRQPDADDARAHELSDARGHAEARAAPEARRADGGRGSRRESGPRLALREAGAARSRKRAQQERRDAADQAGWAALSRDLGVTLIQVSERDTQATDRPKRPNEFVNTWSIDGFVDELMQPSELSIGTSEPKKPAGSHWHRPRCGSVYLHRPGGATYARSWLPSSGGFQGLLMTHDEVFSIADYPDAAPSVEDRLSPDRDVRLSPLRRCHALDARARGPRLDSAADATDHPRRDRHGHGRAWRPDRRSREERILVRVTALDSRSTAPRPYTNATCLQVAAGALGATIWAIRNPREGLREADQLDFREVLEIARPYLGSLVGAYTDWTPLQGRGELFSEELVPDQPWLLQNVCARQWRS